jgi:hypothetical protein
MRHHLILRLLNEIYTALGSDFPQIKTEHLELIQELEESIEIENCYAIPQNVSRVMELLIQDTKSF